MFKKCARYFKNQQMDKRYVRFFNYILSPGQLNLVKKK